jgi:hypothetical protein
MPPPLKSLRSHVTALSKKQKTVLGVLLISSGAFASLHGLRRALRRALREQVELCTSAELLEGSSFDPSVRARRARRQSVAVNSLFVRRLVHILGICVPGWLSPEAGLIYIQTACLVGRTMLTDVASRIEGTNGTRVAGWLA